MNPIRRLREALIKLETSLQEAGAALLAAEETADPAELKTLLAAFEIGGRHHSRREWLLQMGNLQRWHEGLCATSTGDAETQATGQCPEPLLRTRGSDPMVNPGGISPENPVQRAL